MKGRPKTNDKEIRRESEPEFKQRTSKAAKMQKKRDDKEKRQAIDKKEKED